MKKLNKKNVNVNVEAFKPKSSSSCTSCSNGCWSGNTLLVAVRSRIKR